MGRKLSSQLYLFTLLLGVSQFRARMYYESMHTLLEYLVEYSNKRVVKPRVKFLI